MSFDIIRRLGNHHFAHLRAVAEGVDIQASAKRFLGIDHGHQAITAHRQVVDAVRAIARRGGAHGPAWRLVGLTIRTPHESGHPTLAEFISERGLDGWGEEEVTQMHQEAFPSDLKARRRGRLRLRQLELLQALRGLAAETPKPTDLASGWFDDVLATRLLNAGMLTLGDVQLRISAGGAWYSGMPGIGVGKAGRIQAHLQTLLPTLPIAIQRPVFEISKIESRVPESQVGALHALPLPSSDVATFRTNLTDRPSTLLSASTDDEVVQSWVGARAGSPATVKAYSKEARRLLVWLRYECGGKTLASMTAEDCRAYMTFLQHIPAHWISRAQAAPGAPGWTPFRGPLSHKSQQQAIVIVTAFFVWLQNAQYIGANPWVLVNHKTGDDAGERMLESKAISDGASVEIFRYIENQAPSPSRARILFILRFLESVGLRSAEILGATLGDLRMEPEGWVIQVHGKGSKNRIAFVPGQAFTALQEYLDYRGLGGIESAPPTAPLLASALDPMKPVAYPSLYETVKSWLKRAVRASSLPMNERLRLYGASTHWLRHSFGTRAVARNVPLDVIQAQMGHASIQTTMNVYGRAPIRRRAEELGKAFG